MILELNSYIEVQTPLGLGLAVLVIDYGMGVNTCWVVAMKEDGQIKHFDANDIRFEKNFTYKINV